jgi:hypothetical protein
VLQRLTLSVATFISPPRSGERRLLAMQAPRTFLLWEKRATYGSATGR